ncbi:sialidase family protein [Cohnella sp.]|uniref:sialidase family protein n=1 Tax=Cohnella sp. TaxID=1883426 RepID=UPI003703F180
MRNGTVGKVVLELSPSEDNPRNSEGSFIDLKDGRLMFVYSRFVGETEDDYAFALIAKRYSSDQGNSWSEDEIIASPREYDALNIMSVSLLRLANDDIGLFHLIRYGFHDTRLYLRRSSDEGETWSKAVCCMPGPGYYNVNNDRVIRLSSGRLVIPACYFRLQGNDTTDLSSWDPRAILMFCLSDDDGATWRESRSFHALPVAWSKAGFDEPGVIELTNGTVWAWIRTDLGRQYESLSADGGETWSVPTPSIFTSPSSPLSMKRIQHWNNVLLAVWNPIPTYQTRIYERHSGGRSPLVGAISRDEGKTWEEEIAIETDERSGYCYTAIHFVDDSVLLAYAAGNADEGFCLRRLRIRKMKLSELMST